MGNWNAIHRKFWQNLPETLSTESRLLLIYLLTCEQISISGYLEWNPQRIGEETGIKNLDKPCAELVKVGKLHRYKHKAYVPDRDSNDIPRNGNQQKAWEDDKEFHSDFIISESFGNDNGMIPESSGTVRYGKGEGKVLLEGGMGGEKKPKPPKEPEPSNSPVRRISDVYYEEFQKRHDKKPGWGAPETKRTQQVLEKYDGDVERIIRAIRAAFKSTDAFLSEKANSFLVLMGDKIFPMADALPNRDSLERPTKTIRITGSMGVSEIEVPVNES